MLFTVLSLLVTCIWFWLYLMLGRKVEVTQSAGLCNGRCWRSQRVIAWHALQNWGTGRLMPSLIMLSSTGGRSLCGTRQNRFKSTGFNDWVHHLISFLKEILSYTWPLTINQAHTWHAQVLLQDRPLCVFWKSQGGWGKTVYLAGLFVFHFGSYSSLTEVKQKNSHFVK